MAHEDFSDWIGRQESPPDDIITPRLVAEFQATYGAALAPDQDVPLGLHWCLAPPIVAANGLGGDGHPKKGGFLPPVPLPRRMWAGGQIEFIAPLKVGDRVSKRSTIKDITWKNGNSGALCFVTVQHEFNTERGLAIREDHHIVYREAASGPLPGDKPSSSVPSFDESATFDVTNVALFRYSAMTFNGHRIHYDLAYARDVEHYPDLVIHGPLQATLLMNFAAKLKGSVPKLFRYRGIKPATGAQELTVGSTTANGGTDLNVLRADGHVSMVASAE